MIDSAAVVPGWPCIADAGRRTHDRNSASGTGRSGGWRSGAARGGQPGARVVESVIYGVVFVAAAPEGGAAAGFDTPADFTPMRSSNRSGLPQRRISSDDASRGSPLAGPAATYWRAATV